MSTAVFPDLAGIEWPVVRSPIAGQTLIQTSESGNETRVQLWTIPRWEWTLSFEFLRDDSNNEFRTLVAFILARGGSFDSFLFNDKDDNTSPTDQTIGVGDGVTTQFQLIRPFNGTFVEPILAPHVVTNVKVGGVTKTNGVDYGVGNWENGVTPPGTINFFGGHVPVSGAITATFTYYWPVRLKSDQYDFSKFMSKLWEQKKLDFISLKNSV